MTQPAKDGAERIAKVVARAGLCSRREAERWIDQGRVALNGCVLRTPAVLVGPGDDVTVDGRPIPGQPDVRLWRYHKPGGLVTTHRDPERRPTVFEHLPEDLGRVVSVGRLDIASEGLLLLTNSGALARHLELPSTAWTRRYRVRVFGSVDESALAQIEKGITLAGIRYGPVRAQVDSVSGSHAWITMSLQEGKNREVRRILEGLRLQVSRLIRTGYGPFQLGNLERGQVREVSRRVLRDQLGSDVLRAAIGKSSAS